MSVPTGSNDLEVARDRWQRSLTSCRGSCAAPLRQLRLSGRVEDSGPGQLVELGSGQGPRPDSILGAGELIEAVADGQGVLGLARRDTLEGSEHHSGIAVAGLAPDPRRLDPRGQQGLARHRQPLEPGEALIQNRGITAGQTARVQFGDDGGQDCQGGLESSTETGIGRWHRITRRTTSRCPFHFSDRQNHGSIIPGGCDTQAPRVLSGAGVSYGARMRIGAHVRAGKGLVHALTRGADIGAEVVQLFTQSPRMWKPTQYGPDVLAGYRQAQSEHPSVNSTFCHATYLINLATPDPALASKSRACLNANLAAAQGMGADGLVLHIGSHRGRGFKVALPGVVEALIEALDSVDLDPDPCPILLENTAGAGDTVGRSFEELAEIIDAAGGDERLGLCLDTQHLWASGIPFGTTGEADGLVSLVSELIGLDRLRCLHLNDSKVAFGANRDRHENIGAGTIGAESLASLLGHPDLQGLPAILEVPGDGDGPRAEDVRAAREVWSRGVDLRS